MFIKYPHIERLGNDEVDGILIGRCHIFPKIDGTNASVWLEGIDMKISAGSRRRKLTPEQDNAGFLIWVQTGEKAHNIALLLNAHPDWILYGEWLVPHTLRTYRQDSWRRFYVFDVYDRINETFVDYDHYVDWLDAYQLDYIPRLEVCENPTEDHLVGLLNRNTFLIQDGKGPGEGIVIKRYGYTNQYGRTTWAKIVRNEFKESNAKVFGPGQAKMKGGIELELAATYVTPGRIQKMLDKMTEDKGWSSRRIPELFSRVWHDIIDDEMWNILKAHKQPTINFKQFYTAVVQQIKAQKPELF